MSGSPNSSMMLRSQCRSTSDPVPNVNYFILCGVASIVAAITSISCIFYCRYNDQMVTDLKLRNLNYDDFSLSRFEKLVDEKINLYDADKTNQADYALESGGGTIVTTRCTKSYLEKNIQYSIDGILPIFFTSNTPRVVIQPSIIPGECWSFAGDKGVMVVQLSREIIPTSFTYEHVRKELNPDYHINSAPHLFRVRSLKDVNDKEGLLLGDYEYDKNGKPLQQFVVQNPNPVPTKYIELLIMSNHGEMQYTCLYRFRVHGNKYY